MSSDRIPTQFAASLMRLAGKDGYDFSTVLQAAELGFDPRENQDPAWQPEISAMQYSQIYQICLSLLQDETFGLHPSHQVSPGAFRMMCYCIISCENLGKAIHRAADFYRAFFSEEAQIFANFTQQSARVGYRNLGGRGPGHQVDALDAYSLSAWHRFFGWLSGRPIELQRVDFAGEPPRNEAKYRELFACPIYYRQSSNLMYFDSACLKYPLVHTEQSLRDFLRTAPYQLLTMTPENTRANLVAQVRAMVGHDFSHGFPSFETISAALNISAPTLRRRLKREGTTFQQLKDQCRRDAACDYLRKPEMPINQVAQQLGFTDPSAFHRSFKKWTGQTPGQYRAEKTQGRETPAP